MYIFFNSRSNILTNLTKIIFYPREPGKFWLMNTAKQVSQEEEYSELSQGTCFHCGLACPPRPVLRYSKKFCCEGCAVVYELLTESGLSQYYNIENHPGVTMRQASADTRYEFLDDPNILEKVLDFQEGSLYKVEFEIPSIHCASCVWLLENIHRLEPGIRFAQVHFLRKKAVFTGDATYTSPRRLAERLHSLGYAPALNLDTPSQPQPAPRWYQSSFARKLAVAGFCFGNIMLFSFPEYLQMEDAVDDSFRRFFRMLNLLLSLPVTFYSGWEFFRSAWTALRHRLVNIDVPLALGIAVMFVRSSHEILSGTGSGYMDALAGLVFLLLVGRWFQNKSYEALSFERNYRSYFPLTVRRQTAQGLVHTDLDKLQPGDVVVLKNQELIPADAEVLEGQAVLDYSFVTGESIPVIKGPGEKVFAGGRQKGGVLSIKILKSVSQSYLTSLWNNPAFKGHRKTFLSERTQVVSRYFTIAQLFVAGAGALLWWWVEPSKALHVFTSVLIITCPCALALTVPFTLGNSLRILGRHSFYLKNANVIESLSKIDTVVFDKTGTLTLPEKSKVVYEGEPLSPEERYLIGQATKASTHPLSAAIYQTCMTVEETDTPIKVEEVAGQGIVCGPLRLGSASFIGIPASSQNSFETPGSLVFVEYHGKVKGFFRVENTYRDEVANVAKQLKEDGYHLAVLSGDNDREKPQLRALMGEDVTLLFRQKPENKMEHIQQWQGEGKKILMLGDGLNDAGALQQAQVGVALTEDNATFFPAADAMLRASSLSKLPLFLRQAKQSMRTVKLSFLISLLYNSIGLYYALSGSLMPIVAAILMPVSSVTVIALTTGLTFYFAWKNKLFPY